MTQVRTSERGLTLLEMAIAILIAGIILASSGVLYDRAQEQERQRVTQERMAQIRKALSIYVETANRLPCPADPAAPLNPAAPGDAVFGWERGVTLADTTLASGARPEGACTVAQAEGVVPYLTLGLPYDSIRDGWGHYFTYAISPVFSQASDTSGDDTLTADLGSVHERCRTPGWIEGSDPVVAPKSRFCCAGIPNGGAVWPVVDDLVIQSTLGANPVVSPARNGAGARYGLISLIKADAAGLPVAPSTDVLAAAAVLVSHGPDGSGAFVGGGGAGRIAFGPALPNNASEFENADGDRVYRDGPVVMAAGAQYFDDRVLWMTQDGLMAANGTSSCMYP